MTKPAPRPSSYADLGKLQALLIRTCPPDLDNGLQSIPRLAMLMSMTYAAIYYWIEKDRIPKDRLPRLLKLGGRRVRREEFLPYIS